MVNFWNAFRRGVYDDRPLWMRLRHGLIAALAGRGQIIINANLNLAGPIEAKRGDMIANSFFAKAEV